jgi:hypothetical protein
MIFKAYLLKSYLKINTNYAYEIIKKKIVQEQYSFIEREADFCFSHFTQKRVKKRQFMVQPGFVVSYRIF